MCDLTNIRVHKYSRYLQGLVANDLVMGNTYRSKWEPRGSCPFRNVVLESDEMEIS